MTATFVANTRNCVMLLAIWMDRHWTRFWASSYHLSASKRFDNNTEHLTVKNW